MADMTGEQVDALAGYFELMTWNGISRVYRTAWESGILDAVAEGMGSAPVIAERCGVLPGPTSLVLEALCEAGVVRRDGESFGPGPVMALLQGNYRDLGDSYWDHLPNFLRTGEPLIRLQDPREAQAFRSRFSNAAEWASDTAKRPRPSAVSREKEAGVYSWESWTIWKRSRSS